MPYAEPEQYKQAILKIDKLSSIAPVLAKIHLTLQDPLSNVDDIARLIKVDPGLTLNIIRLANSARYGSTSHHSSVFEAVSAVGLREVFHFVQLALSRQMFARDLEVYGIRAEDYWRTSMMSALLMESLARHMQKDEKDAYLIGLLHSTGRVLINEALLELNHDLRWNHIQSMREWEMDAIGFDSAQAGAMLLRRWQFPESVCYVIQGQFKASPTGAMSEILRFVSRTLPLQPIAPPDYRAQASAQEEEESFMRRHRLSPIDVEDIFTECLKRFEETNTRMQADETA